MDSRSSVDVWIALMAVILLIGFLAVRLKSAEEKIFSLEMDAIRLKSRVDYRE